MSAGWALPLSEWGPEVLERGERQRDNERFLPDLEQALRPPEGGELIWPAGGHMAFVPRLARRVHRHRLVPERAQHLHPAPVVPHGGRHHAAGAGHAVRLDHRGRPLRDETEYEWGAGRVERLVAEPRAPGTVFLARGT